jgi:hypothetical protein
MQNKNVLLKWHSVWKRSFHAKTLHKKSINIQVTFFKLLELRSRLLCKQLELLQIACTFLLFILRKAVVLDDDTKATKLC